jgi:hypothetical protein
VLEKRAPPLPLLQNPFPSVSWEEIGGNQSKNTPMECMVKNFRKGFNGDYVVNS